MSPPDPADPATASPPDLSQWEPDKNPFYLEFFGETSPVLDRGFAEVIPAGGQDPMATSAAPVYEYWWTLGHPGAAAHREQWSGVLGSDAGAEDQRAAPIWENLHSDVAARVYLYFPIAGGWRIREIMATVKYLMPVPQQQAWWTKAGQDLQLLSPLIKDAGDITGLVPGGATASKWLNTISKLQVGSVPQSKDFPWTVDKVTFGGNGEAVMQGVAWNLPASLLQAQGGRLTGSLAVSVFPAIRQSATAGGSAVVPGPAKAHAGIYPKDGKPIWIPGPDARSFVELSIGPKMPADARSSASDPPQAAESPGPGR